ncbi:hypothetical protein M758_8G193900 [Ceratodon purpureus]|nr:hypothetical protein M758_8G193900 [Ceratodon purpureus]
MATPARSSFSPPPPHSPPTPTPLERASAHVVAKDTRRKACIDFLLQENYLLTAFELLHELQEDGLVESATKLQLFFANSDLFPADDLAKMHALKGIDAVQLADERELAAEKAAVCEYELRLAREDIKSLQEKLATPVEVAEDLSEPDVSLMDVETNGEKSLTGNGNAKVLGKLGEKEKLDINCAVKEYLMAAGYKISAMTFQEEVNLDLDDWPDTAARVPDAIRRYYYTFLCSTVEAVQDREALVKVKDMLLEDKEALEAERLSLAKTVEILGKDVKEREKQSLQMKETIEHSTRLLNESRAEITSLKLELESLMANRTLRSMQNIQAEATGPQLESVLISAVANSATESTVVQLDSTSNAALKSPEENSESEVGTAVSEDVIAVGKMKIPPIESGGAIEDFNFVEDILAVILENSMILIDSNGRITSGGHDSREDTLYANAPVSSIESENQNEPQEVETVQILADALPKIVPYVLINHREELLPLIMCAIERHPESTVRDSLTHLLFNLIKRPDEGQRRIIMDACVELSKNVGQLRTETELLPQCWEQIDHKYEERRLLVAQSCGELGQLVGSEMRTSLILSIIQQLVSDPASVVREAAAHNLALLLPLFSNMDKYSKVEDLMFALVCDPMGPVVDTSLRELVPALLAWKKREHQSLSQLYKGLLSRLLMAAQRCPPVSGVEGTAEAHLRTLGERERWNIDVLLRLLTQLLPEVQEAAIEAYPLLSKIPDAVEGGAFFTQDVVKAYVGSNMDWPAFDWLVTDCLQTVLQLARMLPPREESLRTRLCKVLLRISECFGGNTLTLVVLPIFRSASGDDFDDAHMSFRFSNRVKGFKPRTPMEERLASMCVLPLLLAGVLGAPNMGTEELAVYLRELILQSSLKSGAWTPIKNSELIDSVRFLCTFEQQHAVILGVLWELVVNSNADVKISAAVLSKALVGNVDLKSATQQVIPALVTLGSDPNADVKHATIEAFGAVAQHFKDEEVVDKVKMQMDSFLEDGSHEATVAVIRALSVAIPLTTSTLRDYLLNKLVILSGTPMPNAKLARRRERADVICEAVRALDATDLSSTSISNLLVPTIQNLLKDVEALDPAHKEALEVILRDRGGIRISEVLTKAVGGSIGSLFGEGGYLRDPGYLNRTTSEAAAVETPPAPPPQEESGIKRMMRGWGRS